MGNISDSDFNEITASEFAINGQVEQSEFSNPSGNLQSNSYRPDFFQLQRWFLTDQLALIPGCV
jgi:hypothetical protein